jgi:hydrogenase maturation protease
MKNIRTHIHFALLYVHYRQLSTNTLKIRGFSMLCILGIGSPFGDDQLGWKVVDHIRQQAHWNPHAVTFECLDRPGLTLLSYFDHRHVFLIDAVQSEQAPGTLHHLEGEQIGTINPTLSSHGIGLAQSIALAQSLDRMPASLAFYGIEAHPQYFQSGTLSAQVRDAIPRLGQQITEHIQHLLERLL